MKLQKFVKMVGYRDYGNVKWHKFGVVNLRYFLAREGMRRNRKRVFLTAMKNEKIELTLS